VTCIYQNLFECKATSWLTYRRKRLPR
jgi:hypothetical protein